MKVDKRAAISKQGAFNTYRVSRSSAFSELSMDITKRFMNQLREY